MIKYTAEQWKEYLLEKRQNPSFLTEQEFLDSESLNPDLIDCEAFWAEATAKFGGNAYCGVCDPTLPLEVDRVNHLNGLLHKFSGSLNFLFNDGKFDVIDYGYGLGSLYLILSENNRLTDYTGVDVYHHSLSLVKKEDSVLFGKLLNPALVFLCLNTFHHLGEKQQLELLKLASKNTVPKGYFILSTMTSEVSNYNNGLSYCNHFGQLTKLWKIQDLVREVSKDFNVVSITQYTGYYSTLWLQKKT